MLGRLRAAALLLALGAACTGGDEQEDAAGVCGQLPEGYCREGQPVTTRCWYESLAYCVEYIPRGQYVSDPTEAKRLCEEEPYVDTTGRFSVGACPGEAIGRCEAERGYVRRDYYYLGFSGFETPGLVAALGSTLCKDRWQEAPF